MSMKRITVLDRPAGTARDWLKYIGGFAAVQTFVSKTTYLTSAAIGMAESKVAGADGDITAAAFIIQFEAGVEIVVAGIKFIDGAGSPLPAQRADICGKRAKISEIAIIDGRSNQIFGSGSIRSISAANQHTAGGSDQCGGTSGL